MDVPVPVATPVQNDIIAATVLGSLPLDERLRLIHRRRGRLQGLREIVAMVAVALAAIALTAFSFIAFSH